MNFIDVVRSTTTNAHHKYDSINKIKIKIMDMAKLEKHECICDYNLVGKEVISELRKEGFEISLHNGWHKMYYTIKW